MKLSIIMPLCNCEEWLEHTLSTIPIRDDVEVIMVENGSTDRTYEICKEYENCNCKLLHFVEPIGCATAINHGYDIATGKYLLQLDGDDYLFTDVLNDILDNDLGADLIYFDMVDNDNKVWHLTEDNCSGLPDHTSLIKRSFLGDVRMPLIPNDPFDIGHGWRMFQILLNKEHTKTFTGKLLYYYNYPREGSVFWNATHKRG